MATPPDASLDTPFNDDYNGFVDIDEYDSDDEGADVREPDDDDCDPIIPLSNIEGTLLDTIYEEEDEPELGANAKKTGRGTVTLSIGQRI
jgi:hypothetical protein